MPKHNNSASRLWVILTSAQQHSGNATYLAWAGAMGIPSDQNHWTAMAVLEHLMWLQEEVNAVRLGMAARGFSEPLYEPALTQVQNAIQPLSLGSAWKENGRACLRPEVMLALAFCADILPDEEDLISEDDLSTIKSIAAELEVMVTTSKLPTQLAAIIQHHIELIHRALAKYPIAGAAALKEAAWTAAGELLDAQKKAEHAGEDFRDLPEVAKMEDLWTKVNATADAVIKAAALVELGMAAYGMLPK